jgi:hypothetical protein
MRCGGVAPARPRHCAGRVPLGLVLVIRLIPDEVKRSAREQALALAGKPTSRAMGVAVVAIWLLVAGALGL